MIGFISFYNVTFVISAIESAVPVVTPVTNGAEPQTPYLDQRMNSLVLASAPAAVNTRPTGEKLMASLKKQLEYYFSR